MKLMMVVVERMGGNEIQRKNKGMNTRNFIQVELDEKILLWTNAKSQQKNEKRDWKDVSILRKFPWEQKMHMQYPGASKTERAARNLSQMTRVLLYTVLRLGLDFFAHLRHSKEFPF